MAPLDALFIIRVKTDLNQFQWVFSSLNIAMLPERAPDIFKEFLLFRQRSYDTPGNRKTIQPDDFLCFVCFFEHTFLTRLFIADTTATSLAFFDQAEGAKTIAICAITVSSARQIIYRSCVPLI